MLAPTQASSIHQRSGNLYSSEENNHTQHPRRSRNGVTKAQSIRRAGELSRSSARAPSRRSAHPPRGIGGSHDIADALRYTDGGGCRSGDGALAVPVVAVRHAADGVGGAWARVGGSGHVGAFVVAVAGLGGGRGGCCLGGGGGCCCLACDAWGFAIP